MKNIYSKNEAQRALKFWRRKLNEAIEDESCNEVTNDTMSAEDFFKEDVNIEEADLPTMEQTLEDENVSGAKYEPNTVGAVIELLKKSDPNGKLLIRLLPNKNECILVDVSRTITSNGEITMFDIAKGSLEG